MDKLQVVLQFVRKHHFWLLCVVAVIASLAGWMMARGTLSDEYKQGKSMIQGKFNSLGEIQKDEFPPNATWKDAIDKLTDAERQKVATAWDAVYNEQQRVLGWPAEILGDEFIKFIKNSKPDAEIPENFRLRYRNEVVNVEFPKLAAIVDAELASGDEKKPTTATDDDAEKPVRQYKVLWESESQQKLQKALMMPDMGVPSSVDVRLRQEDLWVFRALLNIIRETNDAAPFTSFVKQINSLSIGAEAAQEFQEGMQPGHVSRVQKKESGEEAAATPTVASATSEPGESTPGEGRYVDESGNPQGVEAAANEQFRRLPVYMNLEMNQREITRLLTHCANYPLPVEVKQLRINPRTGTETSSQRPAAGPAETGGPSPTARDEFDVTVEIHGIIYIFNPPDPNKLGQPAGDAGAGV